MRSLRENAGRFTKGSKHTRVLLLRQLERMDRLLFCVLHTCAFTTNNSNNLFI